jgi:hypothetical protein
MKQKYHRPAVVNKGSVAAFAHPLKERQGTGARWLGQWHTGMHRYPARVLTRRNEYG